MRLYVFQADFTLHTCCARSVSSPAKVLEMEQLEAVRSHTVHVEQVHSVHVAQLTVDVL